MRRRELLRALAAVGGIAPVAGCSVEDPAGDSGDDSVDASGDIEMVIDGEPVDLSADRFQAEYAETDSIDFHLHEDDDNWYMEGRERLTLGEAIDHLPHVGYERSEGGDVVTVDGEAYDEADPGVEIAFSIDGEAVDPTDYVLRDGDAIRIEIEPGA